MQAGWVQSAQARFRWRQTRGLVGGLVLMAAGSGSAGLGHTQCPSTQHWRLSSAASCAELRGQESPMCGWCPAREGEVRLAVLPHPAPCTPPAHCPTSSLPTHPDWPAPCPPTLSRPSCLPTCSSHPLSHSPAHPPPNHIPSSPPHPRPLPTIHPPVHPHLDTHLPISTATTVSTTPLTHSSYPLSRSPKTHSHTSPHQHTTCHRTPSILPAPP